MNGISPEVLQSLIAKLEKRQETDADRQALAGWMRDLERRGNELDALRRVSQHLTSHLDLKQVLKAILSEAALLVGGINNAYIFLYEAGKLSLGTAWWAAGDQNQPVVEPRPQGMTYSVARLAKSVEIADMSAHPLYAGAGRSGSILGLPLRIGARVVGVMTVCRAQTGDFNDADKRLLALLADHAAVAIENARLLRMIEQQAQVDELTGLYTRRSLNERLESEVMRYQAAVVSQGALGAQHSFTLVMLDLDGFKKINDTYGQQAGDYVLKEVSQAVTQALRKSDFLARFGGDELALLLSDTDQQTARIITSRIQDFVSRVPISLPNVSGKSISVSAGIALFPDNASSVEGLIEAADKALYHAKTQGEGSVVLSDLTAPPLPPAEG